MAIRQEKRVDAPHPEVQDTDYGAQFVKAATETKEEPEVVTLEQQRAEERDVEALVEATAPVEKKEVKSPAKKKGGRPKKRAK